MGFLHDGICWETYDEAMSVKFGTDPVLETSATNGVDKIHFYDYVNGAWHWSEWSTSGGAWTLQYHSPMPVISFPACVPGAMNEQMFNDGLQMGWGVVTAMFAALAVIFISKAIFR